MQCFSGEYSTVVGQYYSFKVSVVFNIVVDGCVILIVLTYRTLENKLEFPTYVMALGLSLLLPVLLCTFLDSSCVCSSSARSSLPFSLYLK